MEVFGWGLVIGAVAYFFLITTFRVNEPEAIDVYRGKTTLEITYRDSVAIDSTVIYKMK